MPREKSRYRDRRSSSYSSDSSYEKKKKSKHKRRSRSRDRSESSSHKRKRSISRSRHKRRSYSRSTSRDRYEKSRRRSSSRSRSKRDCSHSRSSSRSRSKYNKASRKSHRRSRSSGSRSSSFEIGNTQLCSEDLSEVLTSLMKLNIRSKKGPLLSAYYASEMFLNICIYNEDLVQCLVPNRCWHHLQLIKLEFCIRIQTNHTLLRIFFYSLNILFTLLEHMLLIHLYWLC